MNSKRRQKGNKEVSKQITTKRQTDGHRITEQSKRQTGKQTNNHNRK